MKTTPTSKIPSPKLRGAAAMIAWLADRASSALRMLSSAWEHRIPPWWDRTSNEDGAGPSVPGNATDTATQESTLLAPRSSGARNEVRGVEETQHRTPNIERSTLNEEPTADSVFALHIASPTREDRPGPGTAAVPAANRETGERDARAPRQPGADDESAPNAAFRAPSSAPVPNFITRDELKRELDSLRRLVESRK